jgi:hypothetical protein
MGEMIPADARPEKRLFISLITRDISSVGLLQAAVARERTFAVPKKPAPKEIRIQYSAKLSDIQKIANYLRRPGMGGSEVGRYTFNYFLKNEVGGES